PKAGYKWRLTDYEKAPFAQIISIKYDPYDGEFIAWYIGGFGLVGALAFVFFTSHRRIWTIIEDEHGQKRLIIADKANRNQGGFEQLFS
ncbi:cytochrome c biogenesis protein ResB, partial [Escherichia coli]|nr:cytochrome c biogenesis protein ResB [Escherichia coli]